jgi:hypothetical protein
MYVRKKKNRSGRTSVVVVEKKKGKVRYLTTIGVSDNASEIESLYKQGEQWTLSARGDRDMFIENERILKLKGINLSVDKVLDIVKTITTLKIKLPISNQTITKTMILTKKHQIIAKLYDENF